MNDWLPTAEMTEPELFSEYEALRASCPVAHSEAYDGFYNLVTYEDIVAAARDTETFLSDQPFVERRGSPPIIPLSLNGEEHVQYRRLLAPYFTPRRLKALQTPVRAMIVKHLGPLLSEGEADVYQALAYPLPARVLCAFLNVPDAEWVAMKELSELAQTAGGGPPEQQIAVADAFKRKALELIETRRAIAHDPEIDLFARLLAEQLDDETIAQIGWQLIAAGHSTTTRAITVAVHHLATHPADQASLRANPEGIQTAVEELLRIGPPLHQLGRTTANATVLNGTTIPAGEHVGLNFASGNYDDNAFPNARACDLARKPNRHLTFGVGPHICIGAPLARMELRLVLEELLSRTTLFELSGDPLRVTGLKSGFRYLPVRAET
jgi:cytochrome P450